LLSNAIEGATKLLHALEQAASGIGLNINAKKTKHININCPGDIYTTSGLALNSVKQFTYLGSNIASSSKEVLIRIGKAWSVLTGRPFSYLEIRYI